MGQCPQIDFSIPTTICLNERLEINNNSLNTENYVWDFNSNDFDNTASGELFFSVPMASVPTSIKFINDNGLWYGFLSSRDNNKVFRLEFGNSLDSQPVVSELNSIENLLNGPKNMSFIKEDGSWFALLINNKNSTLLRLDFGDQLTNDPVATDLGGFGVLDEPRGLDVVQDGNDIIAVISNWNNNRTTIVKFQNSITAIPSDVNDVIDIQIPNVVRPLGVTLTKECNMWYGLIGSYSNSRLIKLNFGNNLFSIPSTEVIPLPFRPLEVELVSESSIFNAFISSEAGNIYRVKFANGLGNPMSDLENLGNFGTFQNSFGFDMVQDNTNWFAFGVNFSSKAVSKATFQNNNQLSVNLYSMDQRPGNIVFSQPGNYNVTLSGTDVNGNFNSLTKTVTVSGTEAPDIDFSSGNNNCVSNQNNFTGIDNSIGQSVITWNWDFGDGTNILDGGLNPTHQYALPAMQNSDTFNVKVDVVSDNGCSNNFTQQLIIFSEPTPDFNVLEAIPCTNSLVSFENITPGEFGDVISWTWDFGDGENSTQKDPTHAFTLPGTYNVKLSASIPGCTTETTISVDVSEGPLVDYSFINDCLNNSISFTNNTTGVDITGYTWDFGDGTSSNLEGPTHTFADPGDYTVMLTVENALGCNVTNTQTVTVYALPQVAFINELACSNGGTQFLDQSTASGANITEWAWDFGDGNTSSEKDPVHVYQNSGLFPVSLTTTTNFGCTATLEKTVDVIVGPTVDFAINQVCLGEETQFADLSEVGDGSAITSWFWEIDGQVFTEQNPATTFTVPGTYQASLTVTSSTFCTATISKEIVINPLPVADFGVINACVNDFVKFTDESIVTGDAIATYDWSFSNLGNSSDASPSFIFEEIGNYNVTLTITTLTGCISTISKTISILDRPEGSFTTDVSQGPPPLTVTFQNNSTGADNYNWDFGNGENSVVANPIFTFTDLGVFEVSMVAATDAGCTDTVRKTINIVEPLLDVALEGMTTLSQDGKTRVSLDIRNNGTLFVNKMEIALEIGSEATVTETVEQTIAPGELFVYPLNISIDNRATTPYLCATLVTLETVFVEENLVNNLYCINLDEKSNVIKPFPNPSDRLVTVGVVLQESQKVTISMLNALGQPVLEREVSDALEGLNEFQVDVSEVGNGIYWLKLQFGNSEEVFRVFVDK